MKIKFLSRFRLTVFMLWGWGLFLAGCEQTPPPAQETPTSQSTKQGTSISNPQSEVPADRSGPPPYQIDLSQIPLVTSEASEPDTMGLFFCLDVSGSMGGGIAGKTKIEISKEAMRRVFTQIASYVQSHPEKKVKVGLCAFDHRVTLLQPLETFDLSRLNLAIQPLQPVGNTAIGEAMILALKEILKSKVETRAMLVMTDGQNNRGVPPEQVVEAIKQNHNNGQILTADIDVFLVAFDINAEIFNKVKEAGAFVVESRDQKSLESILSTIVEQVLLEAR